MTDEPAVLSEREIEVLKLVATGASNQEIARALVISPNTVKVHLRNIFEKLGVQSRTEATMEAVRRGWVVVDGAALPDNGSGPIEATDAVAIPPLSLPQSPVTRWQRVYMLVAATLIALAAVFPALAGNGAARRGDLPSHRRGAKPKHAEIRTQLPRWSGGAALPSPRSRLALIAGPQRLYAIGGETAAGVTGQVSVYDLAENRWQTAAEKPTAVSNVSGALIGDRIYVPGGMTTDGKITAALEAFDAQTGVWESRAVLPEPLAAYALATLDDRLYLFGGWDGNAYRREVFIYDAATDAWSAATPMPEAWGFAGAAAFDGLIYVAGGYDGAREMADVIAYDPAAESTGVEPWSPARR